MESESTTPTLADYLKALEKPAIARFVFRAILVAAVILRLVLIPNPGFEADISFWKSWGVAPMDHGIVWSMHNTNNNYPTPFTYILLVLTRLYSIFADPHNYYQFWNNMNVWFLAVAKLPSILADFGIAAIILWIGRRARRLGFPEYPTLFYQLLAAIYLLSPLPLIDGALWGQVDSLGVFIFLVALCLALSKRPFFAGVIFMAAMMTKLQNMIYGPVFFLFIWQRMGFTGLVRAVGGALLSFFGLNVEFIIAKDMGRVMDSLTSNYDYFPWLSLNAFNPWWIFSGGRGMEGSDKVLAVGLVNAKTTGLILFSSTYLMAVLFMVMETIKRMIGLKSGQEASPIEESPGEQRVMLFRFLTSLIIVMGAFFFFQTQSHDRYAFPISIFLLLWGAVYLSFHVGLKKTAKELVESPVFWRFLVGYGIFTVIYFYNLHTALIINYPKNGIPFLGALNTPTLTIAASYIQTGLFFAFLAVVWRRMDPATYLIPLAFIAVTLISSNLPLLTRKPVYLTKIKPISYSAGYAARMVDQPANSSLGFNKSTFLSVQYSYYHHGIGTHAPARDVYDIGRYFRKFTFDVGVDTQGGTQGSVTFEIYGDGKKLYDSGLVKRFEYPHHAEVDVTGVRMLELVITDGGDKNFDDHADWLNPQLWP